MALVIRDMNTDEAMAFLEVHEVTQTQNDKSTATANRR
tara:strand:+ start:667 stop:780 length:114 start_codon:yes stop_codon:yes gene_type:complete